MICLKKPSEILVMREAGRRLAEIFVDLEKSVLLSGSSTLEVDLFIAEQLANKGLESATIGYCGYRHSSCVSINNEIVHGVPRQEKVLRDGDLVKVDVVARYKGLCVDMARSFFIGGDTEASEGLLTLKRVTEGSFAAALGVAKPRNYIYDISRAVQDYVEGYGLFVVREFAGHGIGKEMHEPPKIPNYVSGLTSSVLLVPGMALAIEPMVLQQPDRVTVGADGWTASSEKGFWGAHYEDTVVITEHGCEVLTKIGD